MMWAKIIEAKKEMKNPELDSVGRAGKGGCREYKYSSLKAIQDVVEPPLLERGLMLSQHFDGNNILITEVRSDKDCVVMDRRPVIQGAMPQEDGSRETYAKRYALTSAFSLSGDMDDDGASAGAPPDGAMDVALANAKRRLWEAVKTYAAMNGRSPDEVITSVKGAKDYIETVDFLNAKAEEFESECQVVPDAG